MPSTEPKYFVKLYDVNLYGYIPFTAETKDEINDYFRKRGLWQYIPTSNRSGSVILSDPYADIFLTDPTIDADPYPEYCVRIGPLGGIRWERV